MKKRRRKPPEWWLKIINDILAIRKQAETIFLTPGVVLGREINENGVLVGYYIRSADGGGVLFLKSTEKIPVGSIISQLALMATEDREYEINFIDFVYNIIADSVKLIPRVWLLNVLNTIEAESSVPLQKFFKKFPEWVLLDEKYRGADIEKEIVDILYKVARLEGLRGLARFNDYSPSAND